jgi:hypothetical protein
MGKELKIAYDDEGDVLDVSIGFTSAHRRLRSPRRENK